uniref:7TM_GPCR_Srx domain-containing protein n=1 Tax=Heterorhabditis bacteriophora TaxID=37862 RepID=A0A1I7X305_HETBA
MRHGLRMLTSWKFLTNRERIIFKDKREAFTDFCRVSGASILFQIGLALVVVFLLLIIRYGTDKKEVSLDNLMFTLCFQVVFCTWLEF